MVLLERPGSRAAAGGGPEILDVRAVRKTFPTPSGGELVVLDNVNLTLREGEIVGLPRPLGLGRVDLAAHRRRSHPAERRRGDLSRATDRWTARRHRHGIPDLRAFPRLTVLENAEVGLEAVAPRPRRPAARPSPRST